MATLKFDIEKLVTYPELAELSGLPVRTLRTLVLRRAIPVIRLGHRTVLFKPTSVMAALARYERSEVQGK